jgi:anti-sigma regulatory factor (Ser/Thr protein kinase)
MSQQTVAAGVDAIGRATNHFRAPDPGVTSRWVRLAALPSAVPWARRVLRHALRERQLEDLVDPALLLLSELVTNAVQASARHVGRDPGWRQMIALSVQVTDASMFTEVWDASPGLPVLRGADLVRDGGRGLLLVDCLADAWGHYRTDGGKVVWCMLSCRSKQSS